MLAAGLAAAVLYDPVWAKDAASLWYFGLGPAFHSTQDYARSNAARRNDPRPDRFEDREITIEDGFGYGLTAGLGLTRLLSLQLDAGHFKGSVGPVDTYMIDTFPVVRNPFNPASVTGFNTREATIPVSAGEITEIPVSLSGIMRFRRDRPLNPYIGAGFGMIFTGFDRSDDVDRLNDRLASLRIRAILDERHHELTPERYKPLKGDGKVPMTYPVTIDTENAREWHLTAGLEYFLNDRISVAAEARYMFADSSVVIEMKGEDQINLETFSEKVFRKDGSLKFFNDRNVAPTPLLVDANNRIYYCTVNGLSDWDQDGHADDFCYSYQSFPTAPEGLWVVQGGDINLSGLTVHLGMRLWF